MDKLLFSDIKIVLGSQSPRRAELLRQMGIDFQILTKEVDESFPAGLTPEEAVKEVLRKKLTAFRTESSESLIICADTMVAVDHQILGKPKNQEEGKKFLNLLSGQSHIVITGVGLAFKEQNLLFTEETIVTFRALQANEISYYLEQFKPFDKAGAYGIQEWIGHIGIEEIRGSYTNVMGLPTAALYQRIQEFMARFS